MTRRPERKFDGAKLAAMQGLLTVRVEKATGQGSPMVVTPPDSNGLHTRGVNWSRPDVEGIEERCLKWTGGGFYSCRVSDQSSPPSTMEWDFSYDPSQFPPRIPPELADAHINPAVVAAAAATGVPVIMAPVAATVPNAPPGATYPMQSVSVAHPQAVTPLAGAPLPSYQVSPQYPQYVYPPSQATPGLQFPSFMYSPYGGPPAPSSSSDDRVRSLEDQVRQLAIANKELEFSKETERVRNESAKAVDSLKVAQDQQTNALQAEMRRLSEVLTAKAAAPAGPDPAVVALQQQVVDLRAVIEKQTLDAQHRVEIQALQQAFQTQLAGLTTKLDEMNRNKGPDPVVLAMQENVKIISAAMEKVTQAQGQQFTVMQAMLPKPMELATFLQQQGGGAQDVIRMITDGVRTLFDLQQQLMQMQQSGLAGSTILPVVQGALEKGLGAVNEYIKYQKDAKLAEAQVSVAQARVQQQAIVAGMAGSYPATPALPQQQLRGPEPAPVPAAAGLVPAPRPPTDAEMFGVTLEHVLTLRKAIEDGKVGDPAAAAGHIMEGVRFVQERKLQILAFQLYDMNELDKFVEVLLPTVASEFRRLIVGEIRQIRRLIGAEPLDGGDGQANTTVIDVPSAAATPPVEAKS